MSAKAVTIVDYGSGNLRSVSHALEHCGAEVTLTSDPEVIARAERLVLPGVGAFGSCMQELNQRQLIEPIKQFVQTGRSFLGICVGMQILLSVGEEFGEHKGLGFIPGRVKRIMRQHSLTQPVLPYIGWAAIKKTEGGPGWQNTLLENVEEGGYVYFLHSFTGLPENKAHSLAEYEYEGIPVTAAIKKDNITGLQFHPEKSDRLGLAILSSFLCI